MVSPSSEAVYVALGQSPHFSMALLLDLLKIIMMTVSISWGCTEGVTYLLPLATQVYSVLDSG